MNALDSLKELEDKLLALKTSVQEALDDAYQNGFQDGVATTPDYKAFHKAHKDPQHYGEDGEIVVVTGKLTQTGACRKIYKLLKQDIEITYSEVEEQTSFTKILMASEGQEHSYYYDRNKNGVFEAWVWTMS